RSARGTRTFMTVVGLAGSSGLNTSCSGRLTRPSLSRLVSCVMMGVLLSGSHPRLTIGASVRPASFSDEVAGRLSCSGSGEELGGFSRGAGLADAGGVRVRHLAEGDRLPGG